MSVCRIVLEELSPDVDNGTFPAKGLLHEDVQVRIAAFLDGHEHIRVKLLHRAGSRGHWKRVEMKPIGNDYWTASFRPERLGVHEFSVEAWPDDFATWLDGFQKKLKAGSLAEVDRRIGEELLRELAGRVLKEERELFTRAASRLKEADVLTELHACETIAAALPPRQAERMASWPTPKRIWVERELAGAGAWYEFFPRSFAKTPGRHGSLREAERMLAYVADLGFDVVYLPPIHPIGERFRKGPNNALEARKGDVGSPWAIGAKEGGHTAIHPELGSLEDFRSFRRRAESLKLEIALDIAFQCSPDHPWVREHPEWFRKRPDGSIQYAENPPKKYQDIYPFDFESKEWRSLWEALRDVFLFWAKEGVRVFRVDNPHTKPFPFWEWLVGELRKEYPDVILLSEAFTRPHLMQRLAKLGFSQSYTYFTWRSTKAEITEYLTELGQAPLKDFLRPNFWPNTPDILPRELQGAPREAFAIRAVLAASLSPNYGIYGPAFEFFESRPRGDGSEEYLNSEKYELKSWPVPEGIPGPANADLRDLFRRLNRARRELRVLRNAAHALHFHEIKNEKILVCSRRGEGLETALIVVNLDPVNPQSGWVDLDLLALGLDPGRLDQTFEVEDVLNGVTFVWRGPHNYVELHPQRFPAHLFRVRARSECPVDAGVTT